MSNRLLSLTAVLTVTCFGVLLTAGCGVGSDGASISGTVASNGVPLPAGRVVFSSDTATCSGEIVDGKYQLLHKGYRKIPLTEYTITVFPPADDLVYNPETGEEEPVADRLDPKLFPKRYQRKGTSDLKFSPEPGHNEYEIVLEK
ncbi:hypothetical protein [Mariniblastus fucicola]|uniref:Carboxypeptidase regulatory-like domain-containing protein n=1 Tax=Mariniblastus fucicola TaxID=980251 RepID=A0A5B9PJY2_9BACT|nr:hypothetical protein [Mariniblastus fucicola]QEG22961.1 hypothetical protein MFFC18_28520 [Mariniblastus fucicola]